MSNRISKIRKTAEANKKLKKYTLYGSLVGSIIVTLGKLVNKTEAEMLNDFEYYSQDENLFKCKNIKEVCEYIKRDYGVIEDYEKNIVLIYDENNRYTPCVTLEVDDVVLPLDKNVISIGILSHLDEDSVFMEYVFESESEVED